MPSTTDFEEFLFAQIVGKDDFEDILSLHGLVKAGGEGEEGDYSAELATNGSLIIRGHRSDTYLVLTSTAARLAFLRRLEEFAEDFRGDVQSWAYFHRAMKNPKA